MVQNGLQPVTYTGEKRWTNSFLGLDNLHIVLVYVCERKQERVNIMWKGRLSERCTVGRLVCTAALVSDAEENLRYKRIFKIEWQ